MNQTFAPHFCLRSHLNSATLTVTKAHWPQWSSSGEISTQKIQKAKKNSKKCKHIMSSAQPTWSEKTKPTTKNKLKRTKLKTTILHNIQTSWNKFTKFTSSSRAFLPFNTIIQNQLTRQQALDIDYFSLFCFCFELLTILWYMQFSIVTVWSAANRNERTNKINVKRLQTRQNKGTGQAKSGAMKSANQTTGVGWYCYISLTQAFLDQSNNQKMTLPIFLIFF